MAEKDDKRAWRLDPKIGTCRKCMLLSFFLTFVSIIFLMVNVTPAILVGSLGLGAFGTLSGLHLAAYALRRMGLLPAAKIAPSSLVPKAEAGIREQEQEKPSIYCMNCGAALPIDSQFCYYCGAEQ